MPVTDMLIKACAPVLGIICLLGTPVVFAWMMIALPLLCGYRTPSVIIENAWDVAHMGATWGWEAVTLSA